VINGRGADFVAGRDEMLTAVILVQQDDPVTADDVDLDAVAAVAEELATTYDTLAGVDAGQATAEEAAAWDEVLAAVDERRAAIEARVAAVESGDQARIATAFAPDPPGYVPQDAAAALGVTGRDCEAVLEGTGPDGDEPMAEAATACAVAAQLAFELSLADDEQIVLAAVADAVRDEPIDATDELADAATAVADTRRAIADGLAAVEVDGGRAADWATVVAGAEARATAAEARADALESGSESAVADAFGPGGAGVGADPSPDAVSTALAALGLDRRDCRLLG
jgi:hypothetical protein